MPPATLLPDQEGLKKSLHELNALPDGWLIGIDKNKRMTFQKGPTGSPLYIHPTLGDLPKPWILRFCRSKAPRYFNLETSETTTKNPRHDKRILRKADESRKAQGLGESSCFVRVSKTIPLSEYKREDVQSYDIRHNYHIVKILDDPNSKNKIGACNGGVFVVKHKITQLLSVEKRFKEADIHWTKDEVYMLHRLRHASISFFTAGFVTPDLKRASVYVEFCDRGSLENLIRAFGTKRLHASSDAEKPEVPERFIWHAFAGLCDGLAYLMGGRTYLSSDVTDYDSAPGWVPILHRDMKPDNVLIRSRGTVGTKRYFYCVLSDFGLACEDRPPGHPKEDRGQKSKGKCGTKTYWAPELLYNPYPNIPYPELLSPEKPQLNPEYYYFPNQQKHTAKSDLWALGAMMYNLADCGPMSRNGVLEVHASTHILWDEKPPNISWDTYQEGTISHKTLDISKLKLNKPYTSFLSDAIKLATRDQHKRPDPISMLMALKDLMKNSGFINHIPKGHEHEQLPSWATRVHDYHSLPPIDPKLFPEN